MKKPIILGRPMIAFKYDLKMKITTILLIAVFFQINASTYSQNTRISLDFTQVTLGDALDEIESLTEFKFFIDTKRINVDRRVTFKGKNVRISRILKRLFHGTDIVYEIFNKQIILRREAPKIAPISKGVQLQDIRNVPQFTISGTITDDQGVPLAGANVLEKGTVNGTLTDFDGNFTLNVADGNAILVFSYLGFATREVGINNRTSLTINMQEDAAGLDEVVVVGFGTQKKEAVVGAMTSIKPAELKIPSSNLTTALAGRLSGVVSFQTSGEPGEDNAQFFVRGVASFNGQNGPLILIDGVELTADDLARLQPDDIESFSVLKDPTTTAIYGARGANGIILVTTKTGVKGKPVINFRVENSYSAPVQIVDLADPITHMRLQNEADRTRGRFPSFTEEKIASTERGLNPNIYPAINWFDELFQDFSISRRVNLNVRGGGDKVRYYVAGSINNDEGILKVNKENSFSNNIKLNRFLLRSNVNVDLHENTEMIVRLHSTIDDYRGPLQGGNNIYNAAVRTSPVRFPAVFEPDPSLEGVPHILFGNDQGPRLGTSNGNNLAAWFNPYAELQRGYRDYRRQLNLVQLEFKQDLSSILTGLSARFLGNFNNTSYFENRRSYLPYFYRVLNSDSNTGEYQLARTVEGNESLELERRFEDSVNNSVIYMEAAVNYYNTFNEKHNVSGLLVFTAREFLDGNAGTVQLSLPSRNLTLAGRYNYDYDNRYFLETNFGYNGSERFAKSNRFGFFPSFGAGWLVSNEKFFKSKVISRLKLRASYGWVGNDRIGNTRSDRFFYLSEVNIDSPGRGYTFGTEFSEGINGVSISRYANPEVTWETSEKANIGVELNLFDDAVQLRTDIFQDKRSNILQTRTDIPTTLGLQTTIQTNVGEVTQKGIDASLDINHSFNNGAWLQGRATFVYSDNEFTVFEEPNYDGVGTPWRSNIGNNVNVRQGFIAERLFVDDEEALNSPIQFGTPGVDYGGGDIKYKDLNGDGQITFEADAAPIGKPTIPKITYGFGLSGGFKNFDLSCFFQGLAETSFFIDPVRTGPFINSLVGQQNDDIIVSTGNGLLSENGLLQAYADSHWSEENRDVYALWPRLSTEIVQNNVQSSTWWLRDGSFLRLKQVELGYDLADALNNDSVQRFRIYLSGTNLVTWSKFKMWDPELGGRGLNYPLQRVFNLGIQLGF
ncbi:TonB-dependent receptor [Flagellimonas pacifica]|uniref:TonB-linked outer membrane protein, SusC/RagA family n=1 Tax=Flagellimonas pacifica TaxID=1247520 RepID=A0A285MHH1_9FLAO|nr:TonB-dependent receptor [Allomuricauda parva]SNY95406.1 TonB-linked outer membrane protein, SusC/RagA family [Allomuricauda parva]